MPARVVVTGGSGFVGRAVCEHLAEADAACRIVVPTRRLGHAATLRPLPTVELVQADLHDERTLARLLPGADAVVHLVAILQGSAAQFQRVHAELPRKLARACEAAGVRRFVHVSALGVGPGAPSAYLRSKTEGETALRNAALDLTVLRPSVIFGAGDRLLNLFAALQRVAPLIPLAGSRATFQPVWVDDVARAAVRCLERPETAGRVYELTGPQTFTLGEIVRLAGRWSGHERPQIALPDALGRLQALLMEWLPGEPLMSRDNLDSLRVPNVASGALPGLPALGIQPAALGAVAPGYLQPGDRLDHWRAGRR